MEIKDIIHNRRVELGLRMEDLAEKIGVSKGTISRWESGHTSNLKQDKIAPLCRALNLDPGCFVADLPPMAAVQTTETETQNLLERLFKDEPHILNEIQYISIEGNLKDANGAYSLTPEGEALIKMAIVSAIKQGKEERVRKIETKLKGSDLKK